MSNIIEPQEHHAGPQPHGSYQSYCVGFFLSIILTLAAYFAVERDFFTVGATTFFIVTLGLFQAAIQLYFFLHVFEEASPRWNLLAFLFMVLVVVIIVGGSLWIIANLDSRMMTMPM